MVDLEVEVHGVLEVGGRREALVLAHEVGHREVAVGGLALRQKDRVVEADILVAGNALEPLINNLVLRTQPQNALINPPPKKIT
jgi:hypothetical protein